MEIVQCRDPGGTNLGDAIREILLARGKWNIGTLSEMLLFMASRAQLLEEVIRPALQSGKTVLSDRFVLSSYVYQGVAGGLPLEQLRTVAELVIAHTQPDLGIVLDVPYEVSLQRKTNRGALDRMESKGRQYHEKVQEGFRRLAAENPSRYVLIDATGDVESIHETIYTTVLERR